MDSKEKGKRAERKKRSIFPSEDSANERVRFDQKKKRKGAQYQSRQFENAVKREMLENEQGEPI